MEKPRAHEAPRRAGVLDLGAVLLSHEKNPFPPGASPRRAAARRREAAGRRAGDDRLAPVGDRALRRYVSPARRRIRRLSGRVPLEDEALLCGQARADSAGLHPWRLLPLGGVGKALRDAIQGRYPAAARKVAVRAPGRIRKTVIIRKPEAGRRIRRSPRPTSASPGPGRPGIEKAARIARSP